MNATLAETLISTGVGAVIGALVTLVGSIAQSRISDSGRQKRETRLALRQWWKDLRTSIQRFALVWEPWRANEAPSIDGIKPSVRNLLEELLQLRGSLGKCQVRDTIDAAMEGLSRMAQIEIISMGQARKAYDDFVGTGDSTLGKLRELEETADSLL